MGSVSTIAANDLRRRLRDRTFYLQGVVAPLVLAAIIGFAFGGGFTFNATIGVADADGSAISRQLVDGLVSQPADGSPITFKAIDPTDAEASVTNGAVDAAIVLPPGFGTAVAGTQPQPLSIVVDAGKRITADVTMSIGDRIASQLNAVRLAINAALRSGSQTDPTHAQEVIDEGQRLSLAMDVKTEEIGGLYSPIAYYAPSMAMLFLFFTIGAGARSLITERQQGTLQRVRAAPVSDTQILLGKTASVLALGLASLLVVWGVTSTVFHAAWGDPLAVLAVVVAVVVSTAGISLWITAVARTEAQAQGFTSIVAFVLALLGGNFLSPGSLPPLLQKLALVTPNGWALRSFTTIGAAHGGVLDVLPGLAVMVGIGVVAGLAGLRGLAGKVAS